MNLKKIKTLIQKDLSRDWKHIDFEYSTTIDKNAEYLKVDANITLNDLAGSLALRMSINSGKGASFCVTLEKIPKNMETMDLINEFNMTNAFFTAYIRDDGYLELYHFFVCYEEDMFKEYGSEFMYRTCNLGEDEFIQKLTKYYLE